MELREILEELAFDDVTGYRDFTKLQVDLRINEFDIDKAIDRMLTEYTEEEIVERMLELGITRPEILEYAGEIRENLPIDILMKLSL